MRVALLLVVLVVLVLAAPAGAAPTFGAFTHGAPYEGNVDAVDQLEQRLGRRVGIVQWYHSWGGGEWASQVQPSVVNAVVSSGRTPLLTWEPWTPDAGASQAQYSLRSIVRGSHDAYIRSFARGLASLRSTVYLRPMHEMNGNWYPWGGTVNGNSAKQFRAAWRHIVRLFRAEGAQNVRFVWCPLTESVPATRANRMERYWPGARFVDVMALDGYNWGPRRPEAGGERSFKQVFHGPYQRLRKLSPRKPIWIAEVGTSPDSGRKAAWVRSMWRTAAGMRRLKAIVWFDQDKEDDWRAGADDAVAAAFHTA